jgi:proliferating cell nuclear antigen
MSTEADSADEVEPTPEQDTQAQSTDESEQDDNSPARDSTPAVFKLTSSVSTLQSIVNAVDPIVDECRIAVDDSRIRIRASDSAQVKMVDLQVDAQSFKQFESASGALGVNVSRLDEVLSVVDEDVVQLVLDSQTNTLQVSSSEMTCSLALIDPRSIRQAPNLPDLDYPAICRLDGDDLNLAVTAGKKVSDHLYVVVDEDQPELRFEARGDTDSVTYRREPADLVAFEPGDATSKFALDHLKRVNRALPTGPTRRLQIGNTIPLVVRSPFPYADGTVQYLLAPRTDG